MSKIILNVKLVKHLYVCLCLPCVHLKITIDKYQATILVVLQKKLGGIGNGRVSTPRRRLLRVCADWVSNSFVIVCVNCKNPFHPVWKGLSLGLEAVSFLVHRGC